MPKYWGKHIFAHERFPLSGSKEEEGEKKKRKRANDGNNNGQLRIPPGPTK